MSRNVYRLCNSNHNVHSYSDVKSGHALLHWLGHLFVKPKMTMVCITPAHQNDSPLHDSNCPTPHRFASNPSAPENSHDSLRVLTSSQRLEAQQPETDSIPHPQAPAIVNATSTAKASAKKSNMLFLKVYDGPIFQDKKVQAVAATVGYVCLETSPTTDITCSTSSSRSNASDAAQEKPAQTKNLFISGKMSEVYARLEQLAA